MTFQNHKPANVIEGVVDRLFCVGCEACAGTCPPACFPRTPKPTGDLQPCFSGQCAQLGFSISLSPFGSHEACVGAASEKRWAIAPAGRAFVTGFFGAINVGDEAVCKAVVDGLRRQGWARVDVVTQNAAASRSFTGADARWVEGFYPSYQFWLRFSRHVASAARSDLVIVGGGGILQDVHAWTTIAAHLLPACLGIALGCPAVTVGIGAGPIRRKWLRRLTGSVCSMMALVQVRDEASRRVLMECGVPRERIAVTADVALSLGVEEWRAPSRIPAVPPRRIGFALRKWPGLNEDGVVALWERLAAEGRQVELLCYEPAQDKAFYEGLLARTSACCRQLVTIRTPSNLPEAVRAVAAVDALVAMRLHACVFAAKLGIPFLALSYDEKVREFVMELGLSSHLRALSSVCTDWIEDLQLMCRDGSRCHEAIRQRLGALECRAVGNFAATIEARGRKPRAAQRLRAAGWALLLIVVGLAAEWLHFLAFVVRRIGRLCCLERRGCP